MKREHNWKENISIKNYRKEQFLMISEWIHIFLETAHRTSIAKWSNLKQNLHKRKYK